MALNNITHAIRGTLAQYGGHYWWPVTDQGICNQHDDWNQPGPIMIRMWPYGFFVKNVQFRRVNIFLKNSLNLLFILSSGRMYMWEYMF